MNDMDVLYRLLARLDARFFAPREADVVPATESPAVVPAALSVGTPHPRAQGGDRARTPKGRAA